MKFYTTDEIRKAAKGHFFDRDTLRFFDSRIMLDVFDGPGGCYFVTSERLRGIANYPAGARLYTVRHFHRKTGQVTTPQTFQGYASRNGALAAAKRASEDASPRSAAAWKAARTREDNKRRAEDNARQRRHLEHLARVYEAEGNVEKAEHTAEVLRQHREDHPSL